DPQSVHHLITLGSGGFIIGGFTFFDDTFALLPVAVLAIGATWAVLHTTEAGRCIRAVSDDPDAAASRGISIRAVTVGSFLGAAVLTAVAAFFAASTQAPNPPFAFLFTINGFAAFVVGGGGSLWGALLGGWVI